MDKFTRSLFYVVVAFLSISVAAQNQESPFRIDTYRAGPVILGMNAYDLYETFSMDDRQLIDLQLEGTLSPALALIIRDEKKQGEIIAEFGAHDDQLVVSRISISDSVFRTDKGIGVGSTIGELRAAYELNWVDSAEGGVYVRVDELSASFALDLSGPDGPELWKIRDTQEIPANVKIAVVLLTN